MNNRNHEWLKLAWRLVGQVEGTPKAGAYKTLVKGAGTDIRTQGLLLALAGYIAKSDPYKERGYLAGHILEVISSFSTQHSGLLDPTVVKDKFANIINLSNDEVFHLTNKTLLFLPILKRVASGKIQAVDDRGN